MHIKTGDKVVVIKGKDRGKTGIVAAVNPTTNRVKIEGLNVIKRHIRPNPKLRSKGGVVESVGSINIANVMLADPSTNKPTRVGFTTVSGKKMRVTKKSNTTIEHAKK